MADGRNQPRLRAPIPRGSITVATTLKPSDYRLFYALVMERGVSGQETLRQLIRDAAKKGEEDGDGRS